MNGKLTNRKVERKTKPRPWNHEGLRGEETQAAKLTDDQVYDMRIEHKNGAEPEELAEKYKITDRRVIEILTGRAWTHLGLQDIYRRKPKRPKVAHRPTCEQCQAKFTSRTANRRFCSNKCCTANQKGKQVQKR